MGGSDGGRGSKAGGGGSRDWRRGQSLLLSDSELKRIQTMDRSTFHTDLSPVAITVFVAMNIIVIPASMTIHPHHLTEREETERIPY